MMKYLVYSCFILVVWVFNSCDTFNAEEPIPAFITIDTAFVSANTNLQGSMAHYINNVLVFDGVKPLGIFPLPATIPILNQGDATVLLQAGVKFNNQSDNRGVYEVLNTDSFIVNLIPGQSINYQPTFRYKQSAYFDLIYDFELANNFVSGTGSATAQTTSNKSLVFEGNRSLTVTLDDLKPSFKIVSADALLVQVSSAFQVSELPVDGRNTYIEMHYKNDAILTVGLVTNSRNLPNFSSEILRIGPKKEWSKIYIPLSNLLKNNNFDNIKLYFEGTLPDNLQSARFSWDNIKIVHELN